jgi:hypothetical protein
VTAVHTADLVSIDLMASATGVLLTVAGEVDSSTAPSLRASSTRPSPTGPGRSPSTSTA